MSHLSSPPGCVIDSEILIPEPIRPEFFKPLVGIFGDVHIGNSAVEALNNVIPSDIEPSVLLIRTFAHVIRDGLDIVADLLGDDCLNAVDLGILETELIAVVGVNLFDVSKGA